MMIQSDELIFFRGVAKNHQPELDANQWLRSWKCSSAELLRFRRVKRASDGLKGPRKIGGFNGFNGGSNGGLMVVFKL